MVLLALACSPLLAFAQSQGKKKRLVVLGFPGMHSAPNGLDEVVKILGERGWVEGRQLEVIRVTIVPARDGAPKRGLEYLVPEIERQVLPLKPDVILTLGSIMTKGAHLATRTIPIVTTVADPVGLGVADSIARPGGNVTGLTQGVGETSVKLMELMKVLIPRLKRVAIFYEPRPVATNIAAHYERAARSVGIEPVMLSSMDPAELLRALRSPHGKRVQAGVLAWSIEDSEAFIRDAMALRVPLVGVDESSAEAGCLVSFSAVQPSLAPRLAPILEQVLRGADPAGIPFEYPQRFRLVVNRRAAASLGIPVPAELMLRADRVIE